MAIAKKGARYFVKCTNCPHAKDYGAAKLRAEIEAGKHARRYDWHIVEIWEIFVVHRFSARDNAATLYDEEPPF